LERQVGDQACLTDCLLRCNGAPWVTQHWALTPETQLLECLATSASSNASLEAERIAARCGRVDAAACGSQGTVSGSGGPSDTAQCSARMDVPCTCFRMHASSAMCNAVARSAMQAGCLPCKQVVCHASRLSAMQAGCLPCKQVVCHASRLSAMQAGNLPRERATCHACAQICCRGAAHHVNPCRCNMQPAAAATGHPPTLSVHSPRWQLRMTPAGAVVVDTGTQSAARTEQVLVE
jgi:hypothetical protein